MKPITGKACPWCDSTNTRQLTNYGHPMLGRFQCFACKRTWDTVHTTAPDYNPLNEPAENYPEEVKRFLEWRDRWRR